MKLPLALPGMPFDRWWICLINGETNSAAKIVTASSTTSAGLLVGLRLRRTAGRRDPGSQHGTSPWLTE